MNKYRKIPVEVEAVQFTDKSKYRVYAWAKSIQGNVFHDWDENKQPILKIPTLEGEMICSFGDYLIKEPFPTDWRKLYPCKQSIFEQSYETTVSGSASTDDNWTCGCLYKCNDCLKIEAEGGNKHEHFERKDLDYWDE